MPILCKFYRVWAVRVVTLWREMNATQIKATRYKILFLKIIVWWIVFFRGVIKNQRLKRLESLDSRAAGILVHLNLD